MEWRGIMEWKGREGKKRSEFDPKKLAAPFNGRSTGYLAEKLMPTECSSPKPRRSKRDAEDDQVNFKQYKLLELQ